MPNVRPFTSLALLLTALALPSAAFAQTAAPENTPENAFTPPKLLHFEPAAPPSSALEQEAHCLLELVIDVNGHVSDARVVNSGGAELDELALTAARRFEFAPARKGAEPVAVKIRYDYVFEAPPPPPAAEPALAAPPAESQPTAQSAAEKQPAPSAAPASPRADAPLEEFEATAQVEAPPREVTRHTVEAETISRIPGTRGDVLRAIEILPGVARTSLSDGNPILRGAASAESQTYFNGTPVPFLYHFGGLTSFLSPRMVERVDFYPGNFSARYGRVAGGAIDVHPRDPDSQRLRAAVDLNLIDSAAYVETPIGDKGGVAAAARRSNIDFFFKNFVPSDSFSVVAAPVYYDYQLFGFYRTGHDSRLRLHAYGARDALELFFAHPPDTDPALSGNLDATIAFHRVGLEFENRPERGAQSTLNATFGRIDETIHMGSITQAFSGYELYGRAETSFELLPTLRASIGSDLFAWFVKGEYRGQPPPQTEGDPTLESPVSTQEVISAVDNHINVIRPAGYAELAFRPLPELLILPGARFDYYGDVHGWDIDPRLAARYTLRPGTTLKAGVGMYSQAPEWWQTVHGVGNDRIDPYRALQTSAGIEQEFEGRAKLGVEGFYKRLYDVIVATPDRRPPRFENSGRGRVYGVEVSGQARWAGNGLAYVAYTLSRSERSDHGGPFRLFDRDQTHILSLVLSQGLGKGWELGTRFRLVSGDPSTPVISSVYDARTGVYVPIYGGVNSERDPLFHQLDVRVEKSFHAGPFKLAAYLDLQNAYNSKNYQGYQYAFDYSQKKAITGLPIFPNLGLKGEL